MPEIQEAATYFKNDKIIKKSSSKAIMLNFNDTFNLKSKTQTKPYIPIDINQRENYIKNVARKFKYFFKSYKATTK